ncbi:hypothetical protein DLAC_11601 [Tieghemostelium lacteum]|uniref:TCTP domain-containing protein n=1 Tax=Tieghemostelium lacteum TaxID=361077 RepID=A0A151ZKA1_TIELA|nr:hypothetical protein DLAC_11601 [Tieghemostelium lacteum]|eukprot:KYQ94418.1 hypothetical protein DLAC_11601 [Tieghemostelium lacteum]
MKIFNCVIGYSKDEVLSDAFEMVEVGDVVYEVKTKMITKDTNVVVNTGANASEEENEDEGTDSSVVTVNNLVDAQRLVETSFTKKDYLTYIKGYMKAVQDYLMQNNPGRVDPFKKGAQDYVKKVLENFDQYKFYTGENMDADGIVILQFYKPDDATTPYFAYWKDGLLGQKV